MGRDAGTRRQGRAQGGARAPAGRGRHGRHRRHRRGPEALTGLADQLLAFELALARHDGTAIPGGFPSLIDADFEEFGASGRRWDRAGALALLAVPPAADVTIEAFVAVPLGDDVVHVTFRTIARAAGVPARHALRSSVWVRRDGRWRLRFHQGTPTIAGWPTGG